MNKSEQIRQYIQKNPGSTNAQIAEALGYSKAHVSSVTSPLVQREKLTRKQVGKTLSGVPIYAFYWGQEKEVLAQDNVVLKPKRAKTPKQAAPTMDFAETINQFATTLASQIAAQVALALRSELPKVLTNATHQLPSLPHLEFDDLPEVQELVEPEVKPQEKVRKPKVGILGVHNTKQFAIRNEFGSLFDLYFWCSDDGERRLQSLAGSCDKVFVMHYVAHKHTQILTASGAKWKKVMGDMKKLGDDLTEFYLEVTK